MPRAGTAFNCPHDKHNTRWRRRTQADAGRVRAARAGQRFPPAKIANAIPVALQSPLGGSAIFRRNRPRTRWSVLVSPQIPMDRERIAAFCRRHHIRELSLFGSVLGEEFGPDSDVDVLVEFEEGHTPGLAFFAMEEELSVILGRKVDLNTAGFLSPDFRSHVEATAETQYVSR